MLLNGSQAIYSPVAPRLSQMALLGTLVAAVGGLDVQPMTPSICHSLAANSLSNTNGTSFASFTMHQDLQDHILKKCGGPGDTLSLFAVENMKQKKGECGFPENLVGKTPDDISKEISSGKIALDFVVEQAVDKSTSEIAHELGIHPSTTLYMHLKQFIESVVHDFNKPDSANSVKVLYEFGCELVKLTTALLPFATTPAMPTVDQGPIQTSSQDPHGKSTGFSASDAAIGITSGIGMVVFGLFAARLVFKSVNRSATPGPNISDATGQAQDVGIEEMAV